LAGLSGLFLRRFIDSNVSLFFRPASGIISIILGISILIGKKINHFTYEFAANKITNFSSIFILGFIVGILPCAPLIALLFEIVLISHSPLMGMFYAFSFGLGTFLSGLIVLGSLAGIFTWIPAKILKSKISNFIFKIICAFLLILLGISIIFRGFFS
jgi:sulfite exporter TauE/SafE